MKKKSLSTTLSFLGLSSRAKKTLLEVRKLADESALKVYLVGGPVRDLLLKRKVLDLDLVVVGDAVAFAENFSRQIAGTVRRHRTFGTATVFDSDGYFVDFASARTEIYPTSGALPVVRAASLTEDLKRRDFTINAMAVGINGEDRGVLFDPGDGLSDLKKKLIRVLHQDSFKDDPTRILRAVRFEKRLGFHLEKETASWLKEALSQKAPFQVKRPRYFVEFRKILYESAPAKYINRLVGLGALSCIFDGWPLSVQTLKSAERRFTALPAYYSGFSVDIGLVYLLALLGKAPPEEVVLWSREVNLTRQEQATLGVLSRLPEVKKQLSRQRLRPSEIYGALSTWANDFILLLRIYTANQVATRRIDDYVKRGRFIRLAITGDDVKVRLPLSSGKAVGEILVQMLDLRMDGKLPTRSAQLKYIERLTTAS